MDKAQRVDEKKGSFVYLLCSFPELWSIKCQKLLIFLCSADDTKELVAVWAKYLSKSEGSILLSSFKKCCGLLGSELPLARCQPLKIQDIGIFC